MTYRAFCIISILVLVGAGAIPLSWLSYKKENHPSNNQQSIVLSSGNIHSDRALLQENLQQVTIFPFRPHVLGYKREHFGSGWSTRLINGRYCSIREHVLLSAFPTPLSDSYNVPAFSQCTVKTNTSSIDPYTGETMNSSTTDIDHIYPLSAAWDFGAAQWTISQRIEFANDIERNLVATDAKINREKSDSTPSNWAPSFTPAGCAFAARYTSIALHYRLAISLADAISSAQLCSIELPAPTNTQEKEKIIAPWAKDRELEN